MQRLPLFKQIPPLATALFSSVAIFVFVSVIIYSIFMVFNGAGPEWWVALRILLSIVGVIVGLKLRRIPEVKDYMAIMQQDAITIANHWAQGSDLVRLTWYLRAGYLVSAISFVIGLILLFQWDLPQVQNYMIELYQNVPVNYQGMPIEYLYNTKVFPFFLFGLSLSFFTRIVQFIATCHIILYRNNPVRAGFAVFCKECYVLGATMIGAGVPIVATGSMIMAANPMIIPANSITNFINMKIPGFTGYGFPVRTLTAQIRNVFLSDMATYDPWEHVGADKIMDPESQDRFVMNNINAIRKKFSTSQLQMMGIDPPIISNYTGGMVKKGN